MVKDNKFRFALTINKVFTIDKDGSSVEEILETINVKKIRVNPREHKYFLERTMIIIGT